MEERLWASGEAYEPYVGRWSRLVAPEFLGWLAAAPGKDWIDVGCGTGELTRAILRVAGPRSVRSVDPSEAFVAYARERTPDERASFAIGNALSLPIDDASAHAVVSGLVLNFVGDVSAAIAEFRRVTRAGGTIAAYVWDYAGEMQMMRYFWDAAIALDAAAVALDEGARSPICREGALAQAFRDAGLQQVSSRAIDVPTVFADFDDYWTPFLAGKAPAPEYAMSLDNERRSALRDLLRARLPTRDDGSIPLIARAWAAKGVP
jgi:SAM-dependent methyltransferase